MLPDEMRAARRGKGLTREDVAKATELSIQTIKRLEASVGSFANFIHVARFLDFHVSGLARGVTLAEQFSARRRIDGRSLDDVASKAGLTRKTVAALERGEGSLASAMKLLAALAPSAKRAKPVRASFSNYYAAGESDKRFTPPDFLARIYEAFGPVDLDPCGHADSPVIASRRFLLDHGDDGLRDPWNADLVYCNPPFSQMQKWLRRAHDEWLAGRARTIVLLSPARLDSALVHDVLADEVDIYILRGRMTFLNLSGPVYPAPWTLALFIWSGSHSQLDRLSALVPGRFWVRHSSDTA